MQNTVEPTRHQRRTTDTRSTRLAQHADLLSMPVSYDVIASLARRWWNQQWEMFAFLRRQNLRGKFVLIAGCGVGEDAFRLAGMGARVFAFDDNPESIAVARRLAARERLKVAFSVMPAERLDYPDAFFDCVIARDTLHRADIPQALAEIFRVSRPNAVLVVNDVYSCSFVDRIRRRYVIDRPRSSRLPDRPCPAPDAGLTANPRTLTPHDVRTIVAQFGRLELKTYFGAVVGRVVPDTSLLATKLDRVALLALGPLASAFGSRVLLAGRPAS